MIKKLSDVYLKLKANKVNGNGVLPGKVLGHSSEKGLGEEEARDPEDCRWATVDPILSTHPSIRPRVGIS